MNKKYLLVAGLMLGLVVSTNVFAQEPVIGEIQRDDRMEEKAPFRKPIIKKEIREVKREIKGEIKDERLEIKDDRIEKRKEIKDERKENKDEVKVKRDELKKEMEKKRMELKNEQHQKMQVRFDAMVDRFTKMADRIQSRIDKLTSEGKDTTVAQGLLNEARDLITQVDAKADATVIAQGGDEATRLANKKALDEIKALMKQVQDKLHEALKALK